MSAVPRSSAPRSAVADIRRERSTEPSGASRGFRADFDILLFRLAILPAAHWGVKRLSESGRVTSVALPRRPQESSVN